MPTPSFGQTIRRYNQDDASAIQAGNRFGARIVRLIAVSTIPLYGQIIRHMQNPDG